MDQATIKSLVEQVIREVVGDTASAPKSATAPGGNAAPAADKMNNWLPAPKGDFILMMRLYGPNETPPSILPPGKGSWSPPPVKKAS